MKFIPAKSRSCSFRLMIFFWLFIPYHSLAFAQRDTSTKDTIIAAAVANKDNVGKSSNPKVLYGLASFYANKFNGRRTANGEIFRQTKMTCASNKIKLGTWVRVTNIRNGRTVIVKVNDRLHRKMKRLVDLTSAAAKKLGFHSAGLAKVKVEILGKHKPSSE